MPRRDPFNTTYGRKIDCGLAGKSVEEIRRILEEQKAIFLAEDPNFTWDSDEGGCHIENDMNENCPDDFQRENESREDDLDDETEKSFSSSLTRSEVAAPTTRMVKVKRQRKVSSSKYKYELAVKMLRENGEECSLEAINRTAAKVKDLIKTDPEISRAAAEWADERNKDQFLTRNRAIKSLKETIDQVQKKLAELGVSSVFSCYVDGRGYERKYGPLIKRLNKFLNNSNVKLSFASILEAVAILENYQLVTGYCQHLMREASKDKQNLSKKSNK